LIVNRILPFVDRATWDNLIVANREIYQGSRNLEAPWPVGELIRRVDYEEDEEDHLSFSSDGKYLFLLWDQEIRMWHNVVGSCGHITFDVHNRFADEYPAWRVCFSPVENLLVSLHKVEDSDTFRLWEVTTGGLVFKVEGRVVDVVDCKFSRDGQQLIVKCGASTLQIYSVSDAQLIKVIHLVSDRQDARFGFVGITADGRQVVGIEYGMNYKWCRRVCLWDVHGDGSTVEEVYVFQQEECVARIAISPLDDSIAIMTRTGIVKLANRRVQHTTWTVEVVADGKCFDTTNDMSFSTSGQLLAPVPLEGGVEIWDPIKGKRLRTIVCDQLSTLAYSPDGSLLAATTSLDTRLCLYNL
jgi:WD40 repeat protein